MKTMDWLARVREALPVITGDPQQDREIQEELAAHMADRERELAAAGLTASDVAAAVERELVSAVGRKRALGRPPRRVAGDFAQDVRHSLRVLRRSPGFTIASVITLALAIGATTAIYSIVQGILLRPLPYPSPDRLVLVWEVSPQGARRNVVAAGNFIDWTRMSTSFEQLGAMTQVVNRALTGSGEPAKVETVAVTAGVLDALRVAPLHGRSLGAADSAAGAPPVALLSHGFWVRRFGGDPAIVGRPLTLDGRAFTVAGVMPEGFDFPSPTIDLLSNLSFTADAQAERRAHNFIVLGRLKPSVSLAAANAEMGAITTQLAAAHPQFLSGWGVNVVGLHADAVRNVRPLLALMGGVALAVLLIACANIANLQLARTSKRVREMAVRAAIGAGGARLFRQMLTESLVLASLGGALGLAVAFIALRAFAASAPADIPFVERIGLDLGVLSIAAAATVLSALAVGIVPAVRILRTDLRQLLQSVRVRGDRHQRRLRQGLVITQVAIAAVLVASAGLLVRSFLRVNAVAPGYDPRGVLAVEIDLPRARYTDLAAQLRFYEQLFDRLRAQPAIAAAAGTTGVPGDPAGMTFSFAIEGRAAATPSGREAPVPLQGITRDYFDVMRIPLVAGRPFDERDRPDAPRVIIVNQALARLHWPAGNAVGSRINFRPGQMPWAEIVGVVGDTHDEGLAAPPQPTIYVPFAQRASTWAWMTWQTLVVRGRTADAAGLVGDVKATLWSLDPNLPLLDTGTVEQRLAENEARRRMATGLLVAFGCLALLLSTVGVYGVMTQAVTEQRQEIGIRLALGAQPSAVATGLVGRGLAMAVIGVVLGMAGALLATRSLQSLLFEVPPTDPVALGATVVVLLTVAATAAWVPARRAMRVDPLEVLRD